jgi:hypothetical protein
MSEELATTDRILEMATAEEARLADIGIGASTALAKTEVEAQLSAAHQYPRSIARFLRDAISMATITQEVAESCIYTLPRGGKPITGPSVRLAEIAASSYGNLQIGGRVIDVDEKEIIAQGAAWDMERNLRCTIEVRRRIIGKTGQRYNDDMIGVTGAAATSIALRNAIFRVVPRAYIDTVYVKARETAVGNQKTLSVRREQILQRFEKLGVNRERIFERLEKRGIEDISLDDLEVLIGIGTAIKNGEVTIDKEFPEPASAPAEPSQDGKRISLGRKKTKHTDNSERQPGED